MYDKIKFLTAGDSAIVMEFGNTIEKKINAKISAVVENLKEKKIDGILDILPTYRSILINYDPVKISYGEMVEILKGLNKSNKDNKSDEVRLIEIPTLYGREYGPDIEFVAENANLSVDEVIKIHSGTDYLVYMMGFMPGFTYLGGLDERIVTPRLKSPRLKIEAGSVGIAANQTGMYPLESPGGWQLIGRTPLKLYDDTKEPPVFIQAGDYIRYVPITKEEYDEIEKEVEKDSYKISIKKVKRGDLHE
ncbi:5-oxoprolinase subunit PxpB [Peptoniphilus sp. AGMB00490]|uniref:5-oxoprolinase subunit PxpB n=2 Tax=Peptoniphilus TaxID=162289 RepID=A0ACD6AZ95_9FIRM|nr:MULTISPECIES: 5-oxoprolinase subunit PxpB [Peptoniphilus]NMW86099.1 5-oxoprolinase subunit PxpB [Peptoniphilus faecalis]OLR64667.1 allophanate hydrolase [Peptoniphilus porci]